MRGNKMNFRYLLLPSMALIAMILVGCNLVRGGFVDIHEAILFATSERSVQIERPPHPDNPDNRRIDNCNNLPGTGTIHAVKVEFDFSRHADATPDGIIRAYLNGWKGVDAITNNGDEPIYSMAGNRFRLLLRYYFSDLGWYEWHTYGGIINTAYTSFGFYSGCYHKIEPTPSSEDLMRLLALYRQQYCDGAEECPEQGLTMINPGETRQLFHIDTLRLRLP